MNITCKLEPSGETRPISVLAATTNTCVHLLCEPVGIIDLSKNRH